MNEGPESPGQILAAARKRQNLSLAEVMRQLRLSERQLRALESDQYGELPGPVFVRGFIRNYARLLHLDPEPLLAAIEPPPDPVYGKEPAPPVAIETAKPRLWLYGLGAAAAALLLALYFLAQRDVEAPVTSVETAAPKPAAATPSLPVVEQPKLEIPPPALEDDIKLVFKRESFVEIRDASGKPLLNRSNPPGSTQTVVGKPPYSLVIGNAEHVEMTYQGEIIDLAPHSKGGVARLILN
jgi:cytoskeleton protein RodZ